MKRPSLFALVPAALVLAAAPLFAANPPSRGPRVVTRPSASTDRPGSDPPRRPRRLLGPGQHRHPRPGNLLLPDRHRHHQQHDVGHAKPRHRRVPVLLHVQRRLPGLHVAPGTRPAELPELPHGRHRRVPRHPRRPPAGSRDAVLRDLHRDVRRPAVRTTAGRARSRPAPTTPTSRTTRGLARSPSPIPARCSSSPPTSSLVGTIRDTRPAPTVAGALRTNLGVTNTDVNGTSAPVNVQLSFYDVTENSPTNGQEVGNRININDLAVGRGAADQQHLRRRGHPGDVTLVHRVRGSLIAMPSSPALNGATLQTRDCRRAMRDPRRARPDPGSRETAARGEALHRAHRSRHPRNRRCQAARGSTQDSTGPRHGESGHRRALAGAIPWSARQWLRTAGPAVSTPGPATQSAADSNPVAPTREMHRATQRTTAPPSTSCPSRAGAAVPPHRIAGAVSPPSCDR